MAAVSKPPMIRPSNWADLDDDDDDDVGLLTTYNADGTQSTTSYFENAQGKQMKRVVTVRVAQTIHRVSNRVNLRACIKGFGLEAIDKNCEDYKRVSCPPLIGEEPLKVPRRTDLLRSDDDFDQLAHTTLAATASQAYKKDMRELAKGFEILLSQDPDRVSFQPDPEEQGPIHSAGDGRHGRTYDRDDNTVRVTNLSEDVTREDLEKLFSRCGTVSRCHLPQNWDSGKAKGYAFISYQTRKDAQDAITKLHKQGFQNLLLTVEWSKKRDVPQPSLR